MDIANCLFPKISFRLPFTLFLCLSSATALRFSIMCFSISAPPKVEMGGSCSCRSYEDVMFVCPVHRLVMQTCSRQLRSPGTCHLRTFSFTAESFLCHVFHICCQTLIMVVVAASFSSSGRKEFASTRAVRSVSFFVTFNTYIPDTKQK